MLYRTIDLCAGIGGIRRGFELTGHFENVLSAEIDRYAARTYEHLYGDDPTADITSDEFKLRVEDTDYQVLLAGFPCQPFSSVGKLEGFRDRTRGTIFYEIQDILDRTRPMAFLLENVENLVSHNHGDTMRTILTVLENELEYSVIGVSREDDGFLSYTRNSFIRNTKDFGLPQNRPRAYIMGFDRRRFGKATEKLPPSLPVLRSEPIFPDLDSILETDVDAGFYLSSGYLDTLKRHRARQKTSGNGFGYQVVNSAANKKAIANTILATGGSGKERNLIAQHKEGVAGMDHPRKRTPLNDEGVRFMTPTEWGRLQGFIGYAFLDEQGNDTFSFPADLSVAQQYKQFGNSVSIPVIEEMASFMYDALEMLRSETSTNVKK